ncbi:MAG: hypothetical protein LBR71_01565 [Synergistaceae bacterium]|jgi:hypothetical protein|nr:hypothetical protein [Synergistaceae bacterium]
MISMILTVCVLLFALVVGCKILTAIFSPLLKIVAIVAVIGICLAAAESFFPGTVAALHTLLPEKETKNIEAPVPVKPVPAAETRNTDGSVSVNLD